MINEFGGYETKLLQMALNRNQHKYDKDSIDRIDEIIQGQKFKDKIKLKKIQKQILKNLVKKELLKEDGYEDFTYDNEYTNIIFKNMIKLLTRDELMMAPYNYYLSLIFFDLRESEYDSYPSDYYHKYKNLLLDNFTIILHKLGLITVDMIDYNFYQVYDMDEIMNYFYNTPRLLESQILNSFGGKETDVLQMVLNKKKQKYDKDSIIRIDEHLQAMKIQKELNKNTQIKKDKKRMLRGLVEEYLSPDYEYEYGTEYPWDISDEETSDLIKDAYLTLNKDDLDEEPWIEFINKIKESIINTQQIVNNLNSKQKNIIKSSLIYFELLLKKLKLNNNFGKSKLPDNVVDKKLYLKIKTKIQKEVKRKKRKWGAYDSGRLVREYKKEGGKYKGKTKGKQSKSKLDRWYKEKWIDACKWPKKSPCGRSKEKRGITYCRPSIKVNSQTPKTIQQFTKKEIKSKCLKKKKNN